MQCIEKEGEASIETRPPTVLQAFILMHGCITCFLPVINSLKVLLKSMYIT